MLDEIQKRLLEEVADLHDVPEGAYNIRANGAMAARNTTANIDIISKTDKSGIDIKIKDGTKKQSVHIPVVMSQSGMKEWYTMIFISERIAMLQLLQAVGFTILVAMIRSMMESIAFMLEKIQKLNM